MARKNNVDKVEETSKVDTTPADDLEENSEKARGDKVEAPVPAESKPVTVEPKPTPGLLDKFEVTPERGYRVNKD